MFTLLLMAVALSMDAFAVAAATGIRLRTVKPSQALRLAGCFGFFQAAMPLVGWLLGFTVRDVIENYDHWVAFGLLFLVGAHMIWEARNAADHCETPDDLLPEAERKDPTRGKVLLVLGVATSLDALAVGLSLAVLKQGIVFPAVVIGLVTFCITLGGIYLGSFTCRNPFVAKFAGVLGGLMLVGIGVNILYDHGVFS